MTGVRTRLGSRIGVAVATPILLGASLWAGTVAHRALSPRAVDQRTGGASAPPEPASDLSDRPSPAVVGFSGPARSRQEPDPEEGAHRTWFAQGRWWALLARPGDGATTIWGLRGREGPWVDTGVLVDERSFARPIASWSGSELVVASTGRRPYLSHALRVGRFRWNASSRGWERRVDFPVTPTGAAEPGVRLATLADGTAWLVRLLGDGLVVSRSDRGGLLHTAFAPLPDGIAHRDVGAFDMVTDADAVRLVWRSVRTDTIHVASWAGGRWTATAHTVFGAAGSEPIAAAATGSTLPGGVAVVLPTSLGPRGTNDRDAGVLLVVVQGDRATTSVVSRLRDGLIDPTVAVDDVGRVHVLAVAPPAPVAPGSGFPWLRVVDKEATLSTPSFAPGIGRILLDGARGMLLRAPVAPAGVLTASSGLLVTVAGPGVTSWRTAQVGGLAPDGQVGRQAGAVQLVHDTFDGLAVGAAAPAAWHPGGADASDTSIASGPPGTGLALRVASPDGSGGLACRAIPSSGSSPVAVQADLIAGPVVRSDARLLSLRGADGTVASVRLTRKGLAGWSTPSGRATGGLVSPGVAVRVSVRIDPVARTAAIDVRSGAISVAAAAVPLLGSGSSVVDEVCTGPGDGNPDAAIVLTDLVVTRQG